MDEAARINPDAWWWLKADGCEIVKGLKESVKLQWSGDVDLADGSLQKKYDDYMKCLRMAEVVGKNIRNAGKELSDILEDINKNLDFIQSGTVQLGQHIYLPAAPFLELIKFNDTYSEKLQSSRQSEKELITLAWKVEELTEHNHNGRKLHNDINLLINKIKQCRNLQVQDNIPQQLMLNRQKLVSFIKGVTRHQRTPATHILVFMISTEDRRKKPYALPVQCVPYKGLSDLKVRDLANKVLREMVKRKMKVAGMHVTRLGWYNL